MAQQQQTVLKVQTNKVNPNITVPNGTITKTSQSGIVISGSGTFSMPYSGTSTTTGSAVFTVENTSGQVGYTIITTGLTSVFVYPGGDLSNPTFIDSAVGTITNQFQLNPTDVLKIEFQSSGTIIQSLTFNANLVYVYEEEVLDTYGDIPIKINKSFAELQDISKRNSDYSIGLQLPGSKTNNRFFENFYNVDTQTLYFNPTQRIPCSVLFDSETYFYGYLRLNKISVLDSKIEYDVTLYSTVADLFGKIGNNLLKDLNFNDVEYKFNHTFYKYGITNSWDSTPMSFESPAPYIYPPVHNGYNYTGSTPIYSGVVTSDTTRLYTTTGPIGSWPSNAAAYAAGVQRYRINSPQDGIIDNQLKPAMSIWNIIQLIFKTYGYSVSSDFFNTPWFKLLYLYGYYSSDNTKFSFKVNDIQSLPIGGVELVFTQSGSNVYAIVCKIGTGVPCFCNSDIIATFTYLGYDYYGGEYYINVDSTIPAGTSGATQTAGGIFYNGFSNQVPNGTNLSYFPVPINTAVVYEDGDFIDFGLVINQDIKQIDILSSIAKKFNLVFIPNPDIPNDIIIEPYSYYIGTGDVHDWTDKLSFDKGFSVQPAQNFVESELILTDLEDGDEGNKIFKDRNNRIYGENKVYNNTDFKSQQKKIETTFSPELIRRWDDRVGIPLGINYAASTKEEEDNSISNLYKGVKTKPKLMYWLGGHNPFLDEPDEGYPIGGGYVNTYSFKVQSSDGLNTTELDTIPIISHTMPMGNPDANKSGRGFNNDSICILFNSEQPTDVGVSTFNTYTDNDSYSLFYQNRINNVYDSNTRFLSGFFNLKLSDIKNLKPKDLIKVNQQYFTWNKIAGFNLTNPELTQVELVQSNNNYLTYPQRYFLYSYCDNPSVYYKIATDMTNPSLVDTNYGWSVLYDYNVGILGGNVSGFTSTFRDIQSADFKYVAYNMFEVDETTYSISGTSFQYDSLYQNVAYDIGEQVPFQSITFPTFVRNTAATTIITNVFTNCADWNSKVSTFGITTGSSTYHGVIPTPTPTPSPTPTPTPTPTAPMIGSLILTYDKLPGQDDNYSIVKITGGTTGNISTYRYSDINELDMIPLNVGDIVEYYTVGIGGKLITFSRRDYTTDDIDGDMGVRDVFLTAVATGSNSDTVYVYRFVVSKDPLDYNFEYRINQVNYEVLLEVEYNYSSTVDVDRFVQLYVHREGGYSTDYLTNNELLGGFSGTTTGYYPTTLAEISGFTTLQMVRNICENPHEEKSTQRDSSVYLDNVQIGTGITSNVDYIVLDCPDGFLSNYGDTLTNSTVIPLYSTVKFVMDDYFTEKPNDIIKVDWNYTYSGATNIHTNNLYLDVSAFWTVVFPFDNSRVYPRLWLEQDYLTTGEFGSISGITYIDAEGNGATSTYWIGFGNYNCSTLTDDESRIRAYTTWGINGVPLCYEAFPPYDPTWCYGVDWNILYTCPIDPIANPFSYIPVESKPSSPGYELNYDDTWNVYLLDQFCNQDIVTLNYDLEWNFTSNANTGFTIQNVFVNYSGDTPSCGDVDNMGLLPQMIASGTTVTGLSGMVSGTGTTTGSGIIGATLNYSVGMKICFDDSVDSATYRVFTGTSINMYVNDVLVDTTTWSIYPWVFEQGAADRGIAACPSVPPNYVYANFMGISGLSDNDDIRFEMIDELSPSYYNFEVEYNWLNSQALSRSITGSTSSTFRGDRYVQSLSGYSGTTALIVRKNYLYSDVVNPNTTFSSKICNSLNTDTYISRNIKIYKNNVLDTRTTVSYPVNPYTFTPGGTIPVCTGANGREIVTTDIPLPTGLTYNDDVKIVVSDIFQIPSTPTPTPTNTPTPTTTPTPTPTPIPVTLSYRYRATAKTTSRGMTASNMNIDIASANYSRSDLNFTTLNATSSTVSIGTIDPGVIGTNKTLSISRDLCRSSGTTIQIQDSDFNLYINGTLVANSGTSTVVTVPACSSVNSRFLQIFGVTINPGDAIIVEWFDTWV